VVVEPDDEVKMERGKTVSRENVKMPRPVRYVLRATASAAMTGKVEKKSRRENARALAS